MKKIIPLILAAFLAAGCIEKGTTEIEYNWETIGTFTLYGFDSINGDHYGDVTYFDFTRGTQTESYFSYVNGSSSISGQPQDILLRGWKLYSAFTNPGNITVTDLSGRWVATADSGNALALAYDRGNIYVACEENAIGVMDTLDFKVTKYAIDAKPVDIECVEGITYVATEDGTLTAFQGSGMIALAELSLPGIMQLEATHDSNTYENNGIIALCQEGDDYTSSSIYKITYKDGALQKTLYEDQQASQIAVGTNNYLYMMKLENGGATISVYNPVTGASKTLLKNTSFSGTPKFMTVDKYSGIICVSSTNGVMTSNYYFTYDGEYCLTADFTSSKPAKVAFIRALVGRYVYKE